MAEGGSGATRLLSGAVGFVEKSMEIKFFLAFNAFVLLLDSCLIFFYKKNILQSFQAVDAPEISVGGAITFMALFTFMMSLVFRVVRHILQFLLGYTLAKLGLANHRSITPRGDDYHSPWSAEREAIATRDSVALSIVQEHKREAALVESNLTTGFGVFVLFVINYAVLGGDASRTLTQSAALLLDADHGLWINQLLNLVIGLYVITLGIVMVLALRLPEEQDVYLPKAKPREADAQPVVAAGV